MTGHTPQKLPLFRRNLLHHRSARAACPYTRSIMIPLSRAFVKSNFRKNHKIFIAISFNTQKVFSPIPCGMRAAHKALSGEKPFSAPLDCSIIHKLKYDAQIAWKGGLPGWRSRLAMTCKSGCAFMIHSALCIEKGEGLPSPLYIIIYISPCIWAGRSDSRPGA